METGLLDRPLPPFETLGTTPSPDRKSIAEDAETDAEVAIEFEVTEQKERGQRLDARDGAHDLLKDKIPSDSFPDF